MARTQRRSETPQDGTRTALRGVHWLRSLGAGVVAGASDVDPTTVATLAVIGATTAFALSWLTVLLFPMLAVILIVSTRIAVVTGSDLQTLVHQRFGRRAQFVFLGAIVVVVVITIAADLQAGAAALGLLIHVSGRWLALPLGIVVLALLLLGTYDEIQRFLKYVLLVLFAYGFAAVMAHAPWGQVARDTFVPHISFSQDYVSGALALLGTTLSSYVFVWHTVELAEERPALSWLRPKEADAAIGMFFAVAIFWFILIATGATLGRHHQDVQTAQDAARALEPLAGSAASYLFGIGLLGSALLALPVLMGTVAYVVGAEFDWRRSLSEPVHNAPRFYAVMGIAGAIGIAIAMLDISPIQLLFFASIVAGIGTPVTLIFLLLIAGDRRTMRGHRVDGALRAAGWAIAVVMTLLSIAYLVQQLLDR